MTVNFIVYCLYGAENMTFITEKRLSGSLGIDQLVPDNRELSYGYYADEFQLHTQLFTCSTSITQHGRC